MMPLCRYATCRAVFLLLPCHFCSGKQPISTNQLRTTCRATAKRCHATALQRGHFVKLKLPSYSSARCFPPCLFPLATAKIRQEVDVTMNAFLSVCKEIYNLWLDMGIYLIFGFAVAGVLSLVLKRDLIVRHLGKNSFSSVAKASLFGIPLPLCSCGVLPVALSLFQRGASRGATTAFLITTPETGVDSILVTYGLLGPVFAITRPIAALINGLIGGMAVVWTTPKDEKQPNSEVVVTDCCASGDCHADEEAHATPKGFFPQMLLAMRYAFLDFPREIVKWLVIGMVAAGILSYAMPQNFLQDHLGSGFGAMAAMALIGVPMYICATASVPFVAVLISHGGLSAGAALVFLMTGPATNAASLLLIGRMLGKRTMSLYLAAIVISSFLCGTLLNLYFAWTGTPLSAVLQAHNHAEMLPGFWKWFGAIALLIVTITAFVRNFQERMQQRRHPAVETRSMLEIPVGGMSCENCARHVAEAMRSVVGVEEARVDLKKNLAQAYGKNLDRAALVRAICSAGYQAQDIS
ncbi:TPA: hypothetical protein DDW35_01040 [Candidatus Sumerlaeota bacterium]|nr:hypothetical protein [Candidatus Sumerlaeota bacterium]